MIFIVLRFSKMGTLLSIGYIFYEFYSQKIGEFCRGRAPARAPQSFNFQKITGTLKRKFFFFNFQKPSFYIKEQLPKNKI